VEIIYKILTDEESWYLVREMLWTLSIMCKTKTILKVFIKIIPALISHALSTHPEIRLQSLMVLAALSYDYETHPVFLKYRLIDEVIKQKATFLTDDPRFLPIVIILSNLSANTNHMLSLSAELTDFCLQRIYESKSDDLLFKEACKSLANITYLEHFDHKWVYDRYFSAFIITKVHIQNYMIL